MRGRRRKRCSQAARVGMRTCFLSCHGARAGSDDRSVHQSALRSTGRIQGVVTPGKCSARTRAFTGPKALQTDTLPDAIARDVWTCCLKLTSVLGQKRNRLAHVLDVSFSLDSRRSRGSILSAAKCQELTLRSRHLCNQGTPTSSRNRQRSAPWRPRPSDNRH